MALAPIEVLVLHFPGNQFSGGVLPEIERQLLKENISISERVIGRRGD